MTNRRRKNSIIDFLFTLSLFGVFSVCALLVVVIGANVYRSIVNTQEANAMKRTSLAYVAEKMRQSDEAGSIRMGEVEGAPALTLSSVYGQEEYRTYIYQDAGCLKELFIRGDAKPSLLAGQVITEVSDFSVEQVSGQLYLVSCTGADGETLNMYLHINS